MVNNTQRIMYKANSDFTLYTHIESGEAFTSIRGLGKLSGMNPGTVKRYFKTVANEGVKMAEVTTIKGLRTVALITAKAATQYIGSQALEGNKTALKSLLAFSAAGLVAYIHNETGYQEANREVTRQLDLLTFARANTINVHPAFLQACYRNKYPSAHVHEAITKKVVGMTAAEARKLEAILEGDDPKVGLSHYQDAGLLMKVAQAKQQFAGMSRKETWQERVDRISI